ncbi:hypothetical protein FK529_06395 [Tsukamurella asaccharolytica]|uniref:Uncharacterized protein n=1 Tax=Tsukamurella asaccharolytica TaxID=2592067 RepID=A0A5C5REC0_9ACTN|nr:hypothetical protein [Tsukamurella asaccharolytica]TWS20934.1 hypothetical protein FK529_06395 [Tsukamurella asaccharolytica]
MSLPTTYRQVPGLGRRAPRNLGRKDRSLIFETEIETVSKHSPVPPLLSGVDVEQLESSFIAHIN